MEKGSIGESVKELQETLIALGYDPKGVDGIFGNNTEKALKEFQKDVFVTGKADTITLLAMQAKEEELDDKTLTEAQMRQIALKYNLEYELLRSVIEVESAGRGFLPSGKPVILFERHVFWSSLMQVGINPHTVNRPDICNLRAGGYIGGEAEHTRLQSAMALHREAALRSASWGLGQVMGFNFALAGYANLESFVKAMHESEAKQLMAMLSFIERNFLMKALREKRWADFAKGYNGVGYAQNQYDTKLKNAYERFLLMKR